MENRKMLETLKKRGCSERDMELAKASQIVQLALCADKCTDKKKCG